MTNLNYYMQDGANHQARAVLCFLQNFNIEKSWSDDRKKYLAEINVARWENCREQGYVLCLRSKDYRKQLNIAFFEHRNTYSICAVKWEQDTMNSPNIDTAIFGEAYKTRYDTSFDVRYGKIVEMSEWIEKELTKWWEENSL